MGDGPLVAPEAWISERGPNWWFKVRNREALVSWSFVDIQRIGVVSYIKGKAVKIGPMGGGGRLIK